MQGKTLFFTRTGSIDEGTKLHSFPGRKEMIATGQRLKKYVAGADTLIVPIMNGRVSEGGDIIAAEMMKKVLHYSAHNLAELLSADDNSFVEAVNELPSLNIVLVGDKVLTQQAQNKFGAAYPKSSFQKVSLNKAEVLVFEPETGKHEVLK